MSKRRLLAFGVPLALILLGLSAWVVWPQERSAITRVNVAKIQLGMTLAEVESILGGPARMEESPLRSFGWNLDVQHAPAGGEVAIATHEWIGLHAKVEVGVNAVGRVISLSARHPADEDAPAFDLLRRRIGL